MSKVILLGTSHTFQIRNSDAQEWVSEQFRQLLISLCIEHKANGIAEEMNEVALLEHNASTTIAKTVALELRIGHQLSDPPPNIRKSLGIQSENYIRAIGHLKKLSNDDIEAEILRAYRIRESYWLSQLQIFNSYPVVFICGANHVESFTSILLGNSCEVIVAAPDWEPNESDL